MHCFVHGQDGDGNSVPLMIDFDTASHSLSQLPQMFLEPDGSLVWRPDPETDHQLDGVIYDVGPRVQYVEFKGALAGHQWRTVLDCLRSDAEPLLIQLAQSASFLSESGFLAHVESADFAG